MSKKLPRQEVIDRQIEESTASLSEDELEEAQGGIRMIIMYGAGLPFSRRLNNAFSHLFKRK